MKNILVIDDNVDIRFLVFEFLKMENFQVILAEDGVMGLHIAKEKRPDLIVCDIHMPGLNGYEVLELLRKDLATAKIPFIFFTSETESTNLYRARELGADAYLIKSEDYLELIETINLQLKKISLEKHGLIC